MTVSRSNMLVALMLLPPLAGCGTGLTRAAKHGDTMTVNRLLALGADVNAKDELGLTPLMQAAMNGHADVLQALIEKGAEVNARSPNGMNALIFAAGRGDAATVQALLAKGADADAANTDGNTALDIARVNNRTRVVELLRKAALRPPGAAPGEAERHKVEAAEVKPVIHSDVDVPGYKMKENSDNYALVVGIEKYKSLKPDAEFAERDAAAVRDHLLAMGYPRRNIIYLAGQDATRAGIQQYLDEWLPRNVNPRSSVFFYYSGHGAPDVNTQGGEAYLVPWDGNPSFLKTSGYPVKALNAALAKLSAAKKIVVLDSCFSGAGGRSVLPKGAKPLVIITENAIQATPDLTVLAAASGDEISGTLGAQGHGMFTYYFLKGLSGAAKDAAGVVTVQGLHEYLTPLVQDEANHQNRQQTPVMMGMHPEQVLTRFQ